MFDFFEELIFGADKVDAKDVSEMDCNESPRSSTSMEFSVPTPLSEDCDTHGDTAESSTADENAVLPPGACVFTQFICDCL